VVLPYHLPWNPTKWTFYGATFEHVARPSTPILGTVRDKDTGKPLSGVTIQAHKLANNPAPSYMASYCLRTTSDAEGRYCLAGMPIGKDNELLVEPPKDQPYLFSKKTVDTTLKSDSVRTDIELKRGTWIRGKVTDAKTGAAAPDCTVDYHVFHSNLHYKLAPGFDGACETLGTYQTDQNGQYAVPGLPGRGIVTVRARGNGQLHYALGIGLDKIPGQGKLANMAPSPLYPFGKHALAEVNPAEGVPSVQLDFQLDPGQTLIGTVLDPAGKPLKGAQYRGLAEENQWKLLSANTFTINCYRPDHPRKLLFVHLERKLAGSQVAAGVQTGPLSVKLQPWGTITGRLVDADGKPKVDIQIQGDWPISLWQEDSKGEPIRRDMQHCQTDREGRFRIEGLAPGMTYSPSAWNRRTGEFLGAQVFEATVQPGQTTDLGDVKLRSHVKLFSSTWRVVVNLDTANLEPPAVLYAIVDEDPLPGLRVRIMRGQNSYRKRLEGEENKAFQRQIRSSQMSVLWDFGFKDLTADKLHLLTPGNHKLSLEGPDGRKWIVSKTVQINGMPACWCIPVEVKRGKQIKVTLTEDNVFDLASTFDKVMQESDHAK
jgi:hypothetical protein